MLLITQQGFVNIADYCKIIVNIVYYCKIIVNIADCCKIIVNIADCCKISVYIADYSKIIILRCVELNPFPGKMYDCNALSSAGVFYSKKWITVKYLFLLSSAFLSSYDGNNNFYTLLYCLF